MNKLLKKDINAINVQAFVIIALVKLGYKC